MPEQPTIQNHYVPQLYLKGFTFKKSDNGHFFWYLNLQHGASKEATPAKVCKEAYLYTYQTDDGPDDILERKFKVAEDLAAPIIKSIIETHQLPIEQDLAELVGFITLQVVRTTSFRNFVDCHVNHAIQGWAKADITAPGAEKRYSEVFRNTAGFNFEEFQNLILEDGFEWEGTQKYHLLSMLQHFDDLLMHFLERVWSLLIVPDSSKRGFITSDNPVSCGIGSQGIRNSNIVIPLSHETALIGRTYGDSLIMTAPKKAIAGINSSTLGNAYEYVYSRDKDFYWMDSDFQIQQKAHLITAIKQRTGSQKS